MSCFIMSVDALSAVANATETLLNCGYDYFGFEAPEELISACSDCCDNPKAYRPFYYAEKIFRKLYDVNVAAWNGRYPDHAVKEEDATYCGDMYCGARCSVHQPAQYAEHHHAVLPWHYKLAKLLDCWIYQTAEEATYKDDFRNGIKALRDTLYSFIVSRSEEYDRCEWGTL